MAGKIITQTLHEGQVIRLTLNAPKGNILNAELMADLQAAMDELKPQARIKLVQFTGAGDHFCFGASVPEHTREKAPGMLRQFHQLFHTLIDLAVPSAALVSGRCLGGGLELALMCNFLFLDRSARLGQPEINLGLIPGFGGTQRLPRLVGINMAKELILKIGRAHV